MTKELQTINQKIAEKVGKELIDLIPEDEWKRIIDHEIAVFKQNTLPNIIQEMLKESYLSKVKVTVDKLTQSTKWDVETQQQINNELEKFIAASASQIFAGMLSPSIQMILQDLRSRLGY